MLRKTLIAAALVSAALPADAFGIPAFARRYKASCTMCHNPVPKLNAFGETFAANGFRMSAGEEPRDTISTGDPLLALPANLPLAFRLDGYMQAYSKGQASTDFQAPFTVKMLASGPISKSISYYMYIMLLERGEVGGFEDAMLIFNNIGGIPLDVNVGQFQVSDPIYKRELRLMYDDYMVYRMRIGEERANLTYDRGVVAAVEVAGFDVVGELVNGNGIGAPATDLTFDDNGFKNFAGRLNRDITGFLRLGAFGYYGQSDAADQQNEVSMLGADATLTFGMVEVNGQYLHREDTNPSFTANGRMAKTDGGFVEAVVRPENSRFHFFGLYNLINSSAAVINLGDGAGDGLEKYESYTGGLGYLLRRNLRVNGEMTWDTQMERARWSLGFVTAF